MFLLSFNTIIYYIYTHATLAPYTENTVYSHSDKVSMALAQRQPSGTEPKDMITHLAVLNDSLPSINLTYFITSLLFHFTVTNTVNKTILL